MLSWLVDFDRWEDSELGRNNGDEIYDASWESYMLLSFLVTILFTVAEAMKEFAAEFDFSWTD